MFYRLLLVLAITSICFGQDPAAKLAELLGFEAAPNGRIPGGWTGVPPETLEVENNVVHSGKHSLLMERKANSANQFSVISKIVPVDFTGKTFELRGFLRTENVSAFAGLWISEEGEGSMLGFDNMQTQHLNGTNEWKEYSVQLPLHPNAERLRFGVLLTGTGRIWADDLRLLVDGKSILDAPKAEKPKTILDTDQEFDAGSRISFRELTKIQIENLATLGKVWGFLKYHHPLVTSGKMQWDYEMFRVLPKILESKDRASVNAALLQWIAKLGPVADCGECASLPETDLVLRPALSWISDEKLLGRELSMVLQSIYKNRVKSTKQFYVSFALGIGNPVFDRELAYKNVSMSDSGFQLLNIYRFWNIVEYWFPYRDITGENWDAVLGDAISTVALAKDSTSVEREMMALIARAHDSHANLLNTIGVRPPAGACRVPVNVRFLDGRALVVPDASTAGSAPSGLRVGDEITAIDGVKITKLISDWTPYYGASNEAAKLRDMGRSLTAGPCGEVTLAVWRQNEDVSTKVTRVSKDSFRMETTHDLPGETFRLLSEDVAYLKLSSVKLADAASYITRAAHTKGLIIDIRNYPSEFVVFALGNLLVDQPSTFVKFAKGDASNPGAFYRQNTVTLQPAQPHYSGKVIILVDEVSQSQAEYTTMAFRSVPGSVVIGSMTAGADGDVSAIPLPFGLTTRISGIGVFYPDGRPTQRVGIVPDLEVKPTVEGIREGRDEVLEAALRRILGDSVPAATIRTMARR